MTWEGSTYTTSVQVRLSKDLWARMKAYSLAYGRPMSELLAEAWVQFERELGPLPPHLAERLKQVQVKRPIILEAHLVGDVYQVIPEVTE